MAKTRQLTSDEITEMFRRFQKVEGEPKSDLTSVNPYTFLVAVVLSAQATDAGVNRATKALFEVADTPEKMLELGEERLLEYIKTIGLYRGKAKNIMALSKVLVEQHRSGVPETHEELIALPGVGPKTASVVLNSMFGHLTIGVDTHVFRVANRTGLAPGKTPAVVEAMLLKKVPQTYKRYAHHWLILHGRYVCKARKPECWRCLVNDICRFTPKTPSPA